LEELDRQFRCSKPWTPERIPTPVPGFQGLAQNPADQVIGVGAVLNLRRLTGTRCRLEPFVRFSRMILKHLDGILAWTRLRVANGAPEGMNNKVKVISQRAYGFRRTDYYITAIWHGCGHLPLEPAS